MNADHAKSSSTGEKKKKQQFERNHFIWANVIHRAREELELSIKEKRSKFSAEQLLAFSIFFAASESGTCFKQGLVALANILIFEQIPLLRLDEHLHIELKYEHSSHPLPQKTDDELSVRRPVLGPLTFSAITGLMNNRKHLRIGIILDEKNVWDLLKKYCIPKTSGNPKTLPQFCVGAAKYLDRISINPLPIFLREYAKGIHSSTPPPKSNLFKEGGDLKFETQIQLGPIVTSPESQIFTRASDSNDDSGFDAREFEKHLTNAFKGADEKGAKRKARDVRTRVYCI